LPAACIPATPYSHGTTLQLLHGPRDLTAHSHSTLHRSRSSSLHLLANESGMSWMDSNARTKKIKGVILEGDSRKMRPCKQGDPYQRKRRDESAAVGEASVAAGRSRRGGCHRCCPLDRSSGAARRQDACTGPRPWAGPAAPQSLATRRWTSALALVRGLAAYAF